MFCTCERKGVIEGAVAIALLDMIGVCVAGCLMRHELRKLRRKVHHMEMAFLGGVALEETGGVAGLKKEASDFIEHLAHTSSEDAGGSASDPASQS